MLQTHYPNGKDVYVQPECIFPSAQGEVAILHKMDLGQHTLLILADQSIDLVDCEGSAPSHAENGVRLDSLETYRLYISLHELFK